MGSSPGVATPLLLPRVAVIVLMAVLLQMVIHAATPATFGVVEGEEGRRDTRRPRSQQPQLEVVEGCFNRFDALVEIPMEPGSIVGHFNNLRCQAACGARGYSLAATRSNPQPACLCGNEYPSSFNQLDAGRCDAPCNPDHASCMLFTCCGSRNGTLFTVSFARQQNVILQVLRQLAFDYRTSSPTFRGQIEGALVDASPLRVWWRRKGGDAGDDNDGPSFLTAPPAAAAVDIVAGVGECGGDDSWVPFQEACYKLHWAQPVAQEEARRQCLEDDHGGSDVAVPESAAQNAFVTQLQGGCQGWLGLRVQKETEGRGGWNASIAYHNWTVDAGLSSRDGDGAGCVQLRPDGAWIRTLCLPPSPLLPHHLHHRHDLHADCFVCQKRRLSTDASLRDQPVALSDAEADSWRVIGSIQDKEQQEQQPQQQEAEEDGTIRMRLQHEKSGRFLSCSRESGRLVLLSEGDGNGCTTFLALLEDDDDGGQSGGFALTTQDDLVVAQDEGRLVCRPMNPQERWRRRRRGRARERQGITAPALAPDAVHFEPTRMLRVLVRRYLRLSVVVLSSDLNLRGTRECSVAAYDTSPTTASYRCRPLPAGVPPGVDELWLEQQALLVSDWHRLLLPRYPLPLGRLRCVNEHRRQSAICTLAYGRGVTMARAISIDWNLFLFDTITTRCNVEAALAANFPWPRAFAGAGGGEGGEDTGNALAFQEGFLKEFSNDLTVVLSQFYEIAIVRAYVETRNWQTTVRTRPLSTVMAQLWLEEVRLTYRWRALFQARGSFRVLYAGRPIGGQHAVGDVVNYDDLFFFVFGRYDVPEHASIILTIDNRDESRWPLDLPEASVREEPFFPSPPGRRQR